MAASIGGTAILISRPVAVNEPDVGVIQSRPFDYPLSVPSPVMRAEPYRFVGTCISSRGKVRAVNEDAAAYDATIGFAMVADGMGGHRAGDVASQMACRNIEQRLRSARRSVDRMSMWFLQELVEGVNREIHAASTEPGLQGMGATLALLLLGQREAKFLHVGDSRIYRLRGDCLDLLTRDDTLLSEQVAAGLIAPQETSDSHNRHFVTQALGVSDRVTIHAQHDSVAAGDIYLLCTDGLNDLVSDDEIRLILSELGTNLPLAAEHLIQLANDCGGFDNVSVALLRVDDAPVAVERRGWLQRLLGFCRGGARG